MIRYEVTTRWIPDRFAPYAFQTYRFKFPEDYKKLIREIPDVLQRLGVMAEERIVISFKDVVKRYKL